VANEVSVTLAFTTTAPVESFTTPLTLPVSVWPNATAEQTSRIKINPSPLLGLLREFNIGFASRALDRATAISPNDENSKENLIQFKAKSESLGHVFVSQPPRTVHPSSRLRPFGVVSRAIAVPVPYDSKMDPAFRK
jgi:hypothetical protein